MENIYYLAAYFILCAVCFFIITDKEKREESREKMSVISYNVFMFIIYLICPALMLLDIVVYIYKLIVLVVLLTIGIILNILKFIVLKRVIVTIICMLLFGLLAMLKVTGIILCSWWIVILPLFIPIILFIILLITLIIVYIVKK